MPEFPATTTLTQNPDVGQSSDAGLLGWTYDPNLSDGNLTTPTAGTVYLARIDVTKVIKATNLIFYVGTAGTGVQSLVNCFLGLYTSALALIGTTADQSAAWATTGQKSAAITGGPFTIGVGWVYAALLVGTQSTTAVQHVRGNSRSASDLTNFGYAQPPFRCATANTGQTSLPGTASGLAAFHSTPLIGIS